MSIYSPRLNHIYHSMLDRCYKVNNMNYKYYGGKGISVCSEWRYNWKEFEKWALTNGYSDNLSIDRIDNSKGYCPENCRWVTKEIQARNKSNNVYLTYKGETKTLAQFCSELGLNYQTVRSRIRYGFSINEVLSKRNYKIKGNKR